MFSVVNILLQISSCIVAFFGMKVNGFCIVSFDSSQLHDLSNKYVT